MEPQKLATIILILGGHEFQKIEFILVEKFKFSQYCSTKSLKFLQNKYYLLSKFSKLHNLEAHFCELLRPRAPPFQKIK